MGAGIDMGVGAGIDMGVGAGIDMGLICGRWGVIRGFVRGEVC